MPAKRGLILGGTREARQLADMLADDPVFQLVTSLAGVTKTPNVPTGEIRKGGFGGWDGLARYLGDEKIDFLVDATHPFAVRISHHAAKACDEAGVVYLSLVRPPWKRGPDDNWIPVPDMAAAVKTVPAGSRAFLTIGRKDVAAFLTRTDVAWLARSIEPPDIDLPANWTHFEARPPFSLQHELEFLKENQVDILVCKNSGGATESKLAAARELGLRVVMVNRAAPARAPSAETVEELARLLRARFSIDPES